MKIAKRIGGISESLTLALSAKAKQMTKEGIDVVGFGAGEPDFDTPDHIKQTAIDDIQGGFTKYTPASGILDSRKRYARNSKLITDLNMHHNRFSSPAARSIQSITPFSRLSMTAMNSLFPHRTGSLTRNR